MLIYCARGFGFYRTVGGEPGLGVEEKYCYLKSFFYRKKYSSGSIKDGLVIERLEGDGDQVRRL